ncbi:MAG: phage terminase large subunit family protein [Chloroflexota bacterium]
MLASIHSGKGLTLSVEIARQGGKNELSAHLELLLLTIYMATGGSIVKCSPTFKPQTVISIARLKERLEDFGYEDIYRMEMGYIVCLGAARAVFLSAEEHASVVGHTADILLEIDESQDVSKDKYTKEFRPMGSSTNVTTVHYGTTWDDTTLLEEVKLTNLELEKKDGIKRHFRYDWQEVAKYNPDYRQYVEAERARLGDDHPLFRTQYLLLPLRGGGGLLTRQQIVGMHGTHDRRQDPEAGKVYIAGIDLAGEREETKEEALIASQQKLDSTVITIAEVDTIKWVSSTSSEPVLKVVEHYHWTGTPHSQLYSQMVEALRRWKCQRVLVDATGIGQPVASFLRKELGSRIVPFTFTQKSKSDMGFELLSLVNSSRLRIYKNDGSKEYAELMLQLEKARSQYRPNQTMNFYVDPTDAHDDFLMSLALVAYAARDFTPRGAKGGLRDE